jgi:hypothetical protein
MHWRSPVDTGAASALDEGLPHPLTSAAPWFRYHGSGALAFLATNFAD